MLGAHDKKIEMAGGMPQQLKSVNIGRDKATVENNLKFVSISHK